MTRPARARGFTLLEMLVSVAVMVVIILSLYSMFASTQKAFRGISGEVDVLEGGRAAVELISRDIAQAVAGNLENYPNFGVFNNSIIRTPAILIAPDGPGTLIQTNFLQDFFLLIRNGQQWEGHGYYVHRSPSGTNFNIATNGFGALYRFQTNVAALNPAGPMINGFYAANPAQSNSFLILDGVIHLTLRAFNASGVDITPLGGSLAGDRVPHLVELELGVLEPDIVGQARSLPTYAAFTNFLNQKAGKVHYFRQQIPVRSAVR
jgi:prepilin-type N-terminal cleavage/methylation domain-containing protein